MARPVRQDFLGPVKWMSLQGFPLLKSHCVWSNALNWIAPTELLLSDPPLELLVWGGG